MARLIQSVIKTPLADEVLFGRLKNGGTVRVVVTSDGEGKKSLSFVYPDGPLLPRPEKVVEEARAKPRKRAQPKAKAPRPVKVEPSAATGGRGSVPKVPLKS
jgi:ATP-dependent Clp protease ATP-binding subunit ClpA